jgi:hypothetical protein
VEEDGIGLYMDTYYEAKERGSKIYIGEGSSYDIANKIT